MSQKTQPFTENSVVRMAQHFTQIDMLGKGPPAPPWGDKPTLQAFKKVISEGEHHLPIIYQQPFIAPLKENLSRLPGLVSQWNRSGEPAETLLAPFYQHLPDSPVANELRRFQVLVAELFDCFLADEKRAKLNLAMATRLDPIAVFKHVGSEGPFTYPVDLTESTIGAKTTLVSLPSTYRDHPLLWMALAHEAGGHDVLRANPGLLPEMSASIRSFLSSPLVQSSGPWPAPAFPDIAASLGKIWSIWMGEAAADVLGVLNCGAAFIYSFSAFLSAFREKYRQKPFPQIQTDTISEQSGFAMHPTDILRIYLSMGVVGSLRLLSPTAKFFHLNCAARVARRLGNNVQIVRLEGVIRDPGEPEERIKMALPISTIANVAYQVGAFLATASFRNLGGVSFQDLETWSDEDELISWQISDRFLKGEHPSDETPAAAAHLMAGATLAGLQKEESFDFVSRSLEPVLDELYTKHLHWNPGHTAGQRFRA